jgi:hypothetical protein
METSAIITALIIKLFITLGGLALIGIIFHEILK